MRILVALSLAFASIAYADHPSEAPEGYTRYLVPVTATDRAGANGSLWVTEFVVYNADTHGTYVDGSFPFVTLSPVSQDNLVHAGETKKLLLDPPSAGFDGAFVYIADPDAGKLSMSLRVRDISANAQNFGTKIPIVRDAAFQDTILLIEVPTDARYRVTLRLYGYTSDAHAVHMKVYAQNDSRLLDERDVLVREHDLDGFVDITLPYLRPAYVELDPLSDDVRAAGPAVRIEIRSVSSRIWGLASITNNATQQVTVITP